MFHDKNITEPEEVFSFLEDIDIDKSNAFLMHDKLEYMRLKKH